MMEIRALFNSWIHSFKVFKFLSFQVTSRVALAINPQTLEEKKLLVNCCLIESTNKHVKVKS